MFSLLVRSKKMQTRVGRLFTAALDDNYAKKVCMADKTVNMNTHARATQQLWRTLTREILGMSSSCRGSTQENI